MQQLFFGSIATLRQDSTLYSLTNPLLMHNRDLRGANLTRARLVGADLRYSNLTGATTDGTDFSFTNFSGVRIGDKVYADPTVCAIRSIGTCRPDTSLSTINWAELTTGSLPGVNNGLKVDTFIGFELDTFAGMSRVRLSPLRC